SSTGVGLYGQFSLDANGALSFSGSAPLDATLSVTQDLTQQAVGGESISSLFGLGGLERSGRAGQFSLDPAIAADPTKLGLARLDLTVAAGQPVLRAGDGAGALALAGAG